MTESIIEHSIKTFRIVIFLVLDGVIPATIIFVAYSLKYLTFIFPSDEKLLLVELNAFSVILNLSLVVSILIYMVFAIRTIKYLREEGPA